MLNKFYKLFFTILLSIYVGGCASLPTTRQVLQEDFLYLTDVCDRYKTRCEWDSVSQVVTLKKNQMYARALVGSDVVVVEDKQIVLSEPLKIAKSAIVIPSDFKRKVIDLLNETKKEKVSYAIRKIKKIVIDAGHGGKDPGAIGRSGLYEKKVVLDIAKRLKTVLKRKGIGVVMTRESDKFLSLKQRTQIASRSNADLFLSIHANANPVRSVHGVEVYTAKNMHSWERNEDQWKENQNLIFSRLKMRKDDNTLNNIVSDMLYDYKQPEADFLAEFVAKKISKHIGTKNLGAKKSRFYVVRNTIVPAILIEVGFLSNPKEERSLNKKSYRQKIASAIAQSILEYAKAE